MVATQNAAHSDESYLRLRYFLRWQGKFNRRDRFPAPVRGTIADARGSKLNAQQTDCCYAIAKGDMMTRYGKRAQSKVEKTMRERKRGTLRSGRSGRKVTSRKQAIAIGLSEARRAGAKVPKRRSSLSSRGS
jgi:hypothetical protein